MTRSGVRTRACVRASASGSSQEPKELMTAEHDAVHLECELLRDRARRESGLPGFAIRAALASSSTQSLRCAHERVARRSGTIVELGAAPTKKHPPGRCPHATSRSNNAWTRGSPRGSRSAGTITCLDELPDGLFDDRDLEGLLRSEVREQPALGERGLFGEPPDRDSPETPTHRCELECSREDRLPRLFAFGHDH